MQNKFLTMVTYNSGRREIIVSKNAKAMFEDRKKFNSFSTVKDVRTPTMDDLRNAQNDKSQD